MFQNYKIVAVTPAGRQKYLEILVPYILKNRNIIDEYHLWVNTNNASDINYMQNLANVFPEFIKLFFLDIQPSGNETIRFFFQNCIERNTIYIRIDDDICFIERNAIDLLLKFRIENPSYFLVYANIINNSICSYISQKQGNLDFSKGNLTYNVFCERGWKSGEIASLIHSKFIKDYRNNLLNSYKYERWVLSDFERVSVNFITWFGKDFYEFNGIIEDLDEEKWLSVDKPKYINKHNCICGSAIVSHYSYHMQREYLELKTSILQEYKTISEELASSDRNDIESRLNYNQKQVEAMKVQNSHNCQTLNKILLIYQAPWNWDFLWNRAQPLATSLSNTCTVIYLDSGVIESSEEHPESGELVPLGKNLYRYKWNLPKGYQSDPFYFSFTDRNQAEYNTFISHIKQLLYSHNEIWLLTSRPATSGLLDLLDWDKIIVDIEDPWLSLDWGLQIKNTGLFEKLIIHADIIFSNGSAIANEYQTLANKSIHSLPNGVDAFLVNFLEQSLPCPKFMLNKKSNKRAVFTGNINDRIDFELLQNVVRKNIDIDFYFVGILNLPKAGVQNWLETTNLPNFHYISPVAHSEIPAILQYADILLIPYVSEVASPMFPAKLYEYVAAQKIIISTLDFSNHSIKIPSLIVCQSVAEFDDTLKAVASDAKTLSDEEKRSCQLLVLDNSWDARSQEFLKIVKNHSKKLVENTNRTRANQTSVPVIQPVIVTESRPFWSVMIPTYNCANYLVETLKSVLVQDPGSNYMQIEVVDDYSTKDDPEAIVREIGKGRVSFFRQPQNGGIANNFNTCIQRAKGEWVHILHGDDMVLPGFYNRMQESLKNEPTVGSAFCRQIVVDENGQWQALAGLERQTPGILQNWIELLALSQRIETPSIVVKRSVYEHLGGFHLELSHAADWEMWKRIAAHYPMWYEPQPLVYYRKHSASDTSRLIQSGGDIADTRKAIEISQPYLPKAFATKLSNQARKNRAFSAFNTARKMLAIDNMDAAIAQAWEGLNCSDSPEVINLAVAFVKLIDSEQFLARLLQYDEQKQGNKICQSVLAQLHQAFKKKSVTSTTFPTIVVDCVAFQLLERAGITRVWTSLFEEWVNNDFAKHLILLNRAGTAPSISGLQYINIPPYQDSNTERDRQMLQELCDQEGADLFVSTYHTTPISTPSVFLAHDMIPEVMGWNLSHSAWQNKHYSIQHAITYIAVSENTARDLVQFFPFISQKSVTVAKNGVDTQTFSVASPQAISLFKRKYGIVKPYFLLVGIDDDRKNRNLFFKAFSQLTSKEGFDIVCTGSNSLLKPEIRACVSGSAVHSLELNDEELATAYSGAVALVYPSKYEGFGLPVLEAMACGCPVITCLNASIPEVAGKAALYVEDDDPWKLTDALCEVQKPGVRQSLIAAGLEQIKQFSWSKMAETVRTTLIDATPLPLKLKETNFIIFPDWSQSEENLSWDLQAAIQAIATHPDRLNITLLINTSNIPYEDAELFLSSVTMYLLMEEDLDVSEDLEISLVREQSAIQWEFLLSRIQGRIILEHEDVDTIAAVKAEKLPVFDMESLNVINKNALVTVSYT